MTERRKLSTLRFGVTLADENKDAGGMRTAPKTEKDRLIKTLNTNTVQKRPQGPTLHQQVDVVLA